MTGFEISDAAEATGTTMHRRTFLAAAAGIAGVTGMAPEVFARNFGPGAEPVRYPDPDIVGLVEVDTGSIRSRRVNQAEAIAEALGHYSAYQCKYGTRSFNARLPIMRKQGNAFLAAPRVHGERFHYFEKGIKRLIIELELDDCAVFLVHLSLKYRHRQAQLHHLHDLVVASNKPVLVAGDFNHDGVFDAGDLVTLLQAGCYR